MLAVIKVLKIYVCCDSKLKITAMSEESSRPLGPRAELVS
jgi:hypothetical protein